MEGHMDEWIIYSHTLEDGDQYRRLKRQSTKNQIANGQQPLPTHPPPPPPAHPFSMHACL